MRFIGEFDHTLDEKNRIMLPSKFRDAIPKAERKSLVLSHGFEKCLFLFPKGFFDASSSRLPPSPFTSLEARELQRLFFASSEECEMDKQGRILLSEKMRSYAAIDRDVVVIGVSDRIEIWDRARWGEFRQQRASHYEQLAARVFGGVGTPSIEGRA